MREQDFMWCRSVRCHLYLCREKRKRKDVVCCCKNNHNTKTKRVKYVLNKHLL